MGPADERPDDDELLHELTAFAAQDASELDALAARIRELQAPAADDGFDVEAIWSAVELHLDERTRPQDVEDGDSENGSGR
jgi:hypothetical protein